MNILVANCRHPLADQLTEIVMLCDVHIAFHFFLSLREIIEYETKRNVKH